MHESILRDYFLGTASISQLAEDLNGDVSSSISVTHHHIIDMTGIFVVDASHLAIICNAYLSGNLQASHLKTIGFCLIASDAFEWDIDTRDGERVSSVANDWATTEINFPINRDNVNKWIKYLKTGEDQLRCSQ